MRPSLRFRSGSVLIYALPATLIAASGLTFWWARIPHVAIVMDESPTDAQVAGVLLDAGVAPSRLCAAGVTTNAIEAAASAGAAEARSNWSSIDAARTALDAARATYEGTSRLVRRGTASTEQAQAMSSQAAALVSAQNAWNAEIAAVRAAALESLSGDQIVAIDRIAGNEALGVALPYAAATLTDAEAITLRNALANVDCAASSGEDPHGGCASLVASYDALTAVSNASAALAVNAAGAEAAMWSGVAGE